MRIAFLGHGNVGGALADRLQRAGHEVVVAAARAGSSRLAALLARSPALRTAPPAEAVAGADLVVLATPFGANAEVLAPLRAALAGKPLVDCTNPVGPGLTHALASRQSGTEQVQALVPGARVVKAFSIYGYEVLEDPAFPAAGARPVMMLCGDDAGAKAAVSGLAAQLGFEPLDVGGAAQALQLEHLTLLWIRLVRAQGRPPHTAWALLARPAAGAAAGGER